jgi:hypothetical protein
MTSRLVLKFPNGERWVIPTGLEKDLSTERAIVAMTATA